MRNLTLERIAEFDRAWTPTAGRRSQLLKKSTFCATRGSRTSAPRSAGI